MTYVSVRDLPAAVQAALTGVGYGRADIEVVASETVVLSNAGAGAGRRAFASLVNLTTGVHETHWGSWGGENMFVDNAVDSDDRPYPLPGNGVAVTGSRGGTSPVFATLHVPASMVSRILPAAPAELTGAERDALYCYKSVKAGPYRTEELRRRNVDAGTLDALVTRGLLKRNRAGATTITTDGKNALGSYRG